MSSNETPKRKTWLWVIGWIFCFPIPIMILVWRKRSRLPLWAKIVITVVTWLFTLVLLVRGDSSDTSSSTSDAAVEDKAITVYLRLALDRSDYHLP